MQKSNPACVMPEINVIKDKPVTDIETPAELCGNAEESHIKKMNVILGLRRLWLQLPVNLNATTAGSALRWFYHG